MSSTQKIIHISTLIKFADCSGEGPEFLGKHLPLPCRDCTDFWEEHRHKTRGDWVSNHHLHQHRRSKIAQIWVYVRNRKKCILPTYHSLNTQWGSFCTNSKPGFTCSSQAASTAHSDGICALARARLFAEWISLKVKINLPGESPHLQQVDIPQVPNTKTLQLLSLIPI